MKRTLWLDFEKPLEELERELQRTRGIDSLAKKEEELIGQIAKLERKVYNGLNKWNLVRLARHIDRPNILDYLDKRVCGSAIFEDFIELHGDRRFGDDSAIVVGFARFHGINAAVVGHQRGHNLLEMKNRNSGRAHPEGYRKAMRIMELANRQDKPIVVFIDTQGADPGIGAEERGQANAIAESIEKMFSFEVPILVVIIGEGESGGAIAIGVGNRVLMMKHAVYSPVSPEGCVSILWHDDKTKIPAAADILRMTAEDDFGIGVIDEIIPEPFGGAHRDWNTAMKNMETAIDRNLRELLAISGKELKEERFQKFRKMGIYREEPLAKREFILTLKRLFFGD